MIRAARLESELYEEVEHDSSATPQAMAVVVLSSVAAGIARITDAGLSGLIGGAILALVAWFIWSFITYIVGT
jgi:hypothetical protein